MAKRKRSSGKYYKNPTADVVKASLQMAQAGILLGGASSIMGQLRR